MKNIFLLLGLLISFYSHSQKASIKTETISIRGNCDQCKDRIENAADIKGVKNCVWSEKTQVATVTFNSEKTSLETIKKAIAKAGHDADGEYAPDAAYKKLPGCCQYKDRACEDKKK